MFARVCCLAIHSLVHNPANSEDVVLTHNSTGGHFQDNVVAGNLRLQSYFHDKLLTKDVQTPYAVPILVGSLTRSGIDAKKGITLKDSAKLDRMMGAIG